MERGSACIEIYILVCGLLPTKCFRIPIQDNKFLRTKWKSCSRQRLLLLLLLLLTFKKLSLEREEPDQHFRLHLAPAIWACSHCPNQKQPWALAAGSRERWPSSCLRWGRARCSPRCSLAQQAWWCCLLETMLDLYNAIIVERIRLIPFLLLVLNASLQSV